MHYAMKFFLILDALFFSLLVEAQTSTGKPIVWIRLKADSATTILSRQKPIVPPYQIPKGNIFCRMEDAVTRKTGVWLKVGVGSK